MKTQNRLTQTASELDLDLRAAAISAECCVVKLREALADLPPDGGTVANLTAAQILAHIATAAKLAADIRAVIGTEGGQ
jgi:hypothetical protein